MDEQEKRELTFHITQYIIYGYRLHHTIGGRHLYDTEAERQRLEDMQEHHALQYCEMTCSDDTLAQIGFAFKNNQ